MATEDILAQVELFSELPSRDLTRLAKLAVMKSFKKGDVIISEGELGVAFYVVANGQVDVVQGDTTLSTLGPEAFFGEMALFENQVRSASVRAVTDCECVVITRWDFNAELNRPGSRIAVALLPVLARRIRRAEAASH